MITEEALFDAARYRELVGPASIESIPDKSHPTGVVLDPLEHVKARIRVKVEDPFRIIKRSGGFVEIKYPGGWPRTWPT